MAIGVISSPASWLLGTVDAPSWNQNVQDNVNHFLTGSHAVWYAAASLIPISNTSAIGGWNYSSALGYWIATASSSSVTLGLPYRYGSSPGTSDQISAISARIKPGNTGAMVLTVYQITNLSNTSATVVASVGTPANSSGTTDQTITVSGLSLAQTADKSFYVVLAAGQSGDFVYGVNVAHAGIVI